MLSAHRANLRERGPDCCLVIEISMHLNLAVSKTYGKAFGNADDKLRIYELPPSQTKLICANTHLCVLSSFCRCLRMRATSC